MVKLFRYTDKVGGKEMGVCYSNNAGISAISNSAWNCVEIQERDKKQYVDLKIAQEAAAAQQAATDREASAKKVRDQLKTLGIADADLNLIIK